MNRSHCQCGTALTASGNYAVCSHCDYPGCAVKECHPCTQLKRSEGIGPRSRA